jgi:hypothetical protein
MKSRPDYGVLLISIDVEAESSTLHNEVIAAADTAAVLDATKWLVNVLEQCRLPATWFLAGPGASVLRSHIVNAHLRHEIGLLVADGSQGQPDRLDFSRNLDRRILAARAAGIEISSVAARGPKQIEHLDLLVKHGIRAVRQCDRRSDANSSRRSGWPSVSTLRFGITSLPGTLCAPNPARWPFWATAWDMRRQIASAAERRQYCHLTLDIHTLAGAQARKRLQRTLRVAARRFQKPGCRIETMSSLAASLLARPLVRSAQSILRAA